MGSRWRSFGSDCRIAGRFAWQGLVVSIACCCWLWKLQNPPDPKSFRTFVCPGNTPKPSPERSCVNQHAACHAVLQWLELCKKAPQQLDGLPTVLGHNSCVFVKSAIAMLLTCCFLIALDGRPERITSTILASWNTSRAWSTARLIDCCSELKSVPNACQLPLGLQSTWSWCLKHHLEMRSWLLSRLHLSCLHSFKLTDEEKNELP